MMSSDVESELRRRLYRFDCPDAQTLGDYSLDLLGAEQRMGVAAHAVACIECQSELQVVRTYLAAPTVLAEPIAERMRRVVASLFKPAAGLVYGGLRGEGDRATRMFQADDVTLTVGPGSEQGMLIGLVVVDGPPPESVADRAVRLVGSDGSVVSSTLDDLGNFEFGQLSAGVYALEVDLPTSVVVVEGLRVS